MKTTKTIFTNLLPAAALVIATIPFTAYSASAQALQPAVRITQPVDASKLTVLHGNTHPLARAAYDRGPAPATLAMDHMQLVLSRSPQQEAALQTFLAQQQDTSSPNYHKWLTPDEFGQQFGTADEDVQTVTAWLQSNGFTIDGVANGKNIIEFSGNAGQIQSAFHTAIHQYVLPNGEEHWANSTDPQIPAALASVVAGVNTMHDFRKHRMSRFKPTRANVSAGVQVASPSPNITVAGGGCESAGTPCYLIGPDDFATIYNILPLWNAGIDGTGQTIGIVSDSDINLNDATAFRTTFALPTNPPHIILNNGVATGGTDPGIQNCSTTYAPYGSTGDECEAILDVEWAGAVAKGATINLYVAASTTAAFGGDLSAEYIVDTSSVAQAVGVLSYSYGACELELGTSGNQFYNTLWGQAATEGITVAVSTGDNGSAACENPDYTDPVAQPATTGLAVNGLASTPYNVAVGGTDFNDLTNPLSYFSASNSTGQLSALGYIPETTYNDTCTNVLFYDSPGVFTWGTFGTAEAACNSSVLASYDVVVPSGGGGGASTCTLNGTISTTVTLDPTSCSGGYAKPSWQAGLGVPNDGKRDLPDVSLFSGDGSVQNYYVLCEADMTGGAFCTPTNPTGTYSGGGGTSAAVQAFAGIVALMNHAAGAIHQGNINTFLYPLAAKQVAAGTNCNSTGGPVVATCAFYDVTAGTIAMPCSLNSPNCVVNENGDTIGVLSGFNAGVGYDQATGLGSVNVNNLANAQPTFAVSSTGLTITVASPGASASGTFSVSAKNGFTGTVTFACANLPTGATCTFAPASVTFSSTATTASVQMTVNTTTASNIGPALSHGDRPWSFPGSLASISAFCAILLLVGFSRKQHRVSRGWSSALALSAFALIIVAAGCGSSPSSNSTTTTPTSTGPTITATSNPGGDIHSASFTLVIN